MQTTTVGGNFEEISGTAAAENDSWSEESDGIFPATTVVVVVSNGDRLRLRDDNTGIEDDGTERGWRWWWWWWLCVEGRRGKE